MKHQYFVIMLVTLVLSSAQGLSIKSRDACTQIECRYHGNGLLEYQCYAFNKCEKPIKSMLVSQVDSLWSMTSIVPGSTLELDLFPNEVKMINSSWSLIKSERYVGQADWTEVVPTRNYFVQEYEGIQSLNELNIRGCDGDFCPAESTTMFLCLPPREDATWTQPIVINGTNLHTVTILRRQFIRRECQQGRVALSLTASWTQVLMTPASLSFVSLEYYRDRLFLINRQESSVKVEVVDAETGVKKFPDFLSVPAVSAIEIDAPPKGKHYGILKYNVEDGWRWLDDSVASCVTQRNRKGDFINPGDDKIAYYKAFKGCGNKYFDYVCLKPSTEARKLYTVEEHNQFLSRWSMFRPRGGFFKVKKIMTCHKNQIPIPITAEWAEWAAFM